MENLEMNQEFWKDKTVLLTGHTGFKGSWLSLWLQKVGVKLIGFSKDIPTDPSLFESAKVGEGMVSITGNICDFNNLEKIIQKHQPEIVIHMAAQAIVRESYKDPIETYSTNVMGTVNLLEAIRRQREVRVILNVTSDKCYRMGENSFGFKETDPMGGYDPYSSSKGCAELITSSFRESFFNLAKFEEHNIALASVRAGNVIGGGDWGHDRLIPDIFRSIKNEEILKIRNPEGIRPWQFVLEPLAGYLILIQKLWDGGKLYSEPWNFGPDKKNCTSVKWILEKTSDLWDSKINWEVDKSNNYHESKTLLLDCTKAKNRLGWTPKLDLEDALRWTIKWYQKYFKKEDMKKISREQIDEFVLLQ